MRLSRIMTTLFAVAAVLVFAGGCSSSTDDSKKRNGALAAMQRDFQRMKDPRSSISKVREYAAEKLNDATDRELEIINANEPVIKHNYDGTEFSFV